jgi:hypothetical protein
MQNHNCSGCGGAAHLPRAFDLTLSIRARLTITPSEYTRKYHKHQNYRRAQQHRIIRHPDLPKLSPIFPSNPTDSH